MDTTRITTASPAVTSPSRRTLLRRAVTVATSVLAASALTVGSVAPAGATPTGTAPRKALVLYPTWVAGNGSPAAPPDRSAYDVTNAVGETAKAWFRSVSHGQFPAWDARGMGTFRIAPPRMDSGGVCGGQFIADVKARADAAARYRGVEPANYDVVVYYFSRVGNCPWAGLADPSNVWLNGTIAKGTVVQELGHTLDLGHGLALRCRDASGAVITLGGTCTIVPYGDPFNASGSGEGSFSAIQQDDLGWMTGRIQTAGINGGNYTVAPLESHAVAVQALKVPDGNGTLWIEYRRPIGVDSRMPAGTEGVQVRREMPAEHGRKSILLDMAPGGGFWDARLPVGRTFTSPYSRVSITVASAGDAGAQIQVRYPMRTVPNVLGKTQSVATQALRNQTFGVRAVSQIDETCDRVGLVMRQSPSGGTQYREGAVVTIYIGKAPSYGCPA